MNYFQFLNDIIANFRVSKMIEIVKIEQDTDNDDLLVIAYEATRALIVVANYKEKPVIEMPLIQGFAQLDFVKQIIGLEEYARQQEEKVVAQSKNDEDEAQSGKKVKSSAKPAVAKQQSSVKFKKNDDDIAIETHFKIGNTSIKSKNVAQSLLPETPRKLSGFVPDFEFEFDDDLIQDILRKLSLSIFNANVFVTKSNKGELSLRLTNDVDVVDIDLPFSLDEDVLTDPFKIDLDRFLSILKIGSGGIKFAISGKQNLARIIKDTDIAEYKYFLIKKAT